ncbi:MAG: hypothetical protein AAGB19_18440, partial [Cyanobacteria bacterium P01_F01_bin.3]
FIVGLVAVVTPGPDFALTLRSSLAYSRRSGVYTAVGIGLGNTIHATYSLAFELCTFYVLTDSLDTPLISARVAAT